MWKCKTFFPTSCEILQDLDWIDVLRIIWTIIVGINNLENFLVYNLSIIVILVRSHLCFTFIPTRSNFYFISIPTKLDSCFLFTFIKSYFCFNFVPIRSCLIFINIKSMSYFTCTPMKSNSCFTLTKILFSTPLNKELTTLWKFEIHVLYIASKKLTFDLMREEERLVEFV